MGVYIDDARQDGVIARIEKACRGFDVAPVAHFDYGPALDVNARRRDAVGEDDVARSKNPAALGISMAAHLTSGVRNCVSQCFYMAAAAQRKKPRQAQRNPLQPRTEFLRIT
jgi:hypothetical protein